MSQEIKISWLGNNWSLIASLAILWVTISILFIEILNLNHLHFTYILDDTYIHMAMAKNFVEYGVWGVTKYGFSSSTSSILWVLLLSLIYKIVGVNDMAPFILNVVFVSAAVVLVYHIFNKCKFPQWYSFIVLLLMVFLAAIPILIFTGMEHCLQILVVIPFVYLSAKLLSKDDIDNRDYLILVSLGVLLTLIRYESLFLIGIVFLLFLLKRKYLHSVVLLGLSVIPMIIFGMISISNGWLFFPNSLVVKSVFIVGTDYLFSTEGLFMFAYLLKYNLDVYIYLVLFLFICLVFFVHYFNKLRSIWDFKSILLIIFILLTFVNLVLTLKSSINEHFYWFFRYDAYIIVLGLFIIAICLRKYIPENSLHFKRESIPRYIAIFLLILLVLSPFSLRLYSLKYVPQASNNIYEQQYQMGLFLKEYYPGESIALNDLGAISYLGDVKITDLWMLGSMEMLPYFQSEQNNNPDVLVSVAKSKNVQICLVYDQAYKSTPPGWIKVAEWVISNNKVCSYDTVSFYATSPEEAQKLLNNLNSYSAQLPSDVQQKFFI